MSDSLVVLHSTEGKYATKRITRFPKTGKVVNHGYDKAVLFRVERIAIASFPELAAALHRLTSSPHAFVIRGEPGAEINLNHTRRRFRRRGTDPATFVSAPRPWFAVDLDHLPCPPTIDPITDPDAAIEYLVGLLPKELQDACCWWQFTSSQSLPLANGAAPGDHLSARLWLWNEGPLTDAELKRWAAAANGGGRIIDPSLYHAIQPHYIAAPIFDGMGDPLPRRHGVRRGLEDTVSLLIPPPDPKDPEKVSGEGLAPGRGTDAYLAEIGGAKGFREPIKSAVASFVAIHGAKAHASKLKEAIRKTIDQADPGGRSNDVIERYKSDEYLDDLIRAIRAFQGDKPGIGRREPSPLEGPLGPEPPPPVGDPDPPPVDWRPIVRVQGGELPKIVDRAEAILATSDLDVYAFGDALVRPALAPITIADRREVPGLRLVPIGLHHLIERFTRLVNFQTFNKKEQHWVSIDCPHAVANAYLDRVGLWRIRKLTVITACPQLLPSGRIIERAGYDEETGVLFDPQGTEFEPVPPMPTRHGAEKALDDIKEFFTEFPFVDDASRAVHLSAVLSVVARLAFRFAPMHAYDSPVPGTGKSKLVDCCSILGTGHECGVTSTGNDEIELEKRLGALLLAGDRIISLDNCDAPLQGGFLCQTLSQARLSVRVLGFSKRVEIPNATLLYATGNNLVLRGDITRRAIRARLDAGVERPELRPFKKPDPAERMKRERGAIALAALTVLRAYQVAKSPNPSAQPLGGFEGWSRVVRDALIWLGQPDPIDTMEHTRKHDPARQTLEAVLEQWRRDQDVAGKSCTTADLVEHANKREPVEGNPKEFTYKHPDFRAALLAAGADRSGKLSAPLLGRWLSRNKNKVIADHRIVEDAMRDGFARWKLDRVPAERPA
jgi:hypothetical protein